MPNIKKATRCFSLSILLLCLTSAVFAQKQKKMEKKLRHVVIFAFKESASKQGVDSVIAAFKALPGQLPQVKKFEWGLNISKEHLDQGFTHCFVLTFHSDQDLADYAVSAPHKHFQAVLNPYLAKVFVVDFWTEPE